MSPSNATSSSRRHSKTTTAQKTNDRLRRYVDAPAHEDPYAKPEGVTNRNKRLIEDVNSMITAFQFARPAVQTSRQVRKPSHQLLRYIDAPAYLPGEKMKMRRKDLMADMDVMLSQIQGVPIKKKEVGEGSKRI